MSAIESGDTAAAEGAADASSGDEGPGEATIVSSISSTAAALPPATLPVGQDGVGSTASPPSPTGADAGGGDAAASAPVPSLQDLQSALEAERSARQAADAARQAAEAQVSNIQQAVDAHRAKRKRLMDENHVATLEFACDKYLQKGQPSFLVSVFGVCASIDRFALVRRGGGKRTTEPQLTAAMADGSWTTDEYKVRMLFMKHIIPEAKKILHESVLPEEEALRALGLTDDDHSGIGKNMDGYERSLERITQLGSGDQAAQKLMDEYLRAALVPDHPTDPVGLDSDERLTNCADAVVELKDYATNAFEIRDRRLDDRVCNSTHLDARRWLKPREDLSAEDKRSVETLLGQLRKCVVNERALGLLLQALALPLFNNKAAAASKTVVIVCTGANHGKSLIVELIFAAYGDYARSFSVDSICKGASETSRSAFVIEAGGARIYVLDELSGRTIDWELIKWAGTNARRSTRPAGQSHTIEITRPPYMAIFCNPPQLGQQPDRQTREKLMFMAARALRSDDASGRGGGHGAEGSGEPGDDESPLSRYEQYMGRFVSSASDVDDENHVYLMDANVLADASTRGGPMLHLLYHSICNKPDVHLRNSYLGLESMVRKRDNEWVLEEQAVEMLAAEDQKARQRVKLAEARERAKAQAVQGVPVAASDTVPTEVRVVGNHEFTTVEEALRKLVESSVLLVQPRQGYIVTSQELLDTVEKLANPVVWCGIVSDRKRSLALDVRTIYTDITGHRFVTSGGKAYKAGSGTGALHLKDMCIAPLNSSSSTSITGSASTEHESSNTGGLQEDDEDEHVTPAPSSSSHSLGKRATSAVGGGSQGAAKKRRRRAAVHESDTD